MQQIKPITGFLTAEFISQLFQDSPYLIFVKDQKFRVVYGNNAFLALYPPARRESLIGSDDLADFTEEQVAVFTREDRKAFDSGYAELVEELTDHTGQIRILQTTKTRFTNSDGEILMLGVSVDITRHAQRERELAQANVSLENFAALAAHDLRAPLSSISSGLELLKLELGEKTSQPAQKLINIMHRTCDSLMGQITSLLSVYKSSHDHKVRHDDIDIPLLLGEIKITLAQPIARCSAKILTNSIPTIHGDRNLFRQLLQNLVETV